MIGPIPVLELAHFLGDRRGAALIVAASERGLGAPVASVGAAARRRDVKRKPAVRLGPRGTIRFDVEQVPGRKRQPVEIGPPPARGGPMDPALSGIENEAGNVLESGVAEGGRNREVVGRELPFAGQYGRGAGIEIEPRVVGGVGRIDRDVPPLVARHADHRQGVGPPVLGAHLRQEIEVVFDQDEDRGNALRQSLRKGFRTFIEGSVEHFDPMPSFAQNRRREQRCQGRVGFVPGKLLSVPGHEVRMSKKHQCPVPDLAFGNWWAWAGSSVQSGTKLIER